jgi:hypothetical protein
MIEASYVFWSIHIGMLLKIEYSHIRFFVHKCSQQNFVQEVLAQSVTFIVHTCRHVYQYKSVCTI